MIKEIKINCSSEVLDSQRCSSVIACEELASMISVLDKCCGQYCVVVDVVESSYYAAYRNKLRQISTLLEQLTKRESEVLRLVIKGMPNKVISNVLSISVETVKSHRKKIVAKIGVQKVSDLLNILYDAVISKTLHLEMSDSNLYSEKPAADSLIPL